MNNLEKGRKGEIIVCDFLTKNGYQILEKNYRYHHKEVDIIAAKGHDLVFVEVKTRSNEHYGRGIEAIRETKMRNMISVARYYLHQNRLHNVNVRFDVASFENKKLCYIEDAFRS